MVKTTETAGVDSSHGIRYRLAVECRDVNVLGIQLASLLA